RGDHNRPSRGIEYIANFRQAITEKCRQCGNKKSNSQEIHNMFELWSLVSLLGGCRFLQIILHKAGVCLCPTVKCTCKRNKPKHEHHPYCIINGIHHQDITKYIFWNLENTL